MGKISLVLEGGGMRGVYTAGVLDFFIEKNIEVDYLIGVSAGACKGASYVTKQFKRNYRIDINYVNDKRYLSMGNLIKTGSMFGMDMLFNIIPHELEPFDFDGFKNSKVEYVVGATNCNTGKAEYFTMDDFNVGIEAIKASISLPLIAPIINYEGMELLDGGISAPIPIEKSIEDGNKKHIVILTQHKGYVKSKDKTLFLIKRKYKKYPKLVEAMEKRHDVYNSTLELLNKLEEEGSCMVIRPSMPLDVSRMEKDKVKLDSAYSLGYEDAKKEYEKLKRFLED